MNRIKAVIDTFLTELPAQPFHSIYVFSKELRLIGWRFFSDIGNKELKPILDELEQTLIDASKNKSTLPNYIKADQVILDRDPYWLVIRGEKEQVPDQTHWELSATLLRNKWLEQKTTAEIILHNQYQEQIVETISEGFMSMDRHGRISYLNQPGARILGVNVFDVIGKHISDVVDFQPEVLSVLETGKGWVNREFFIQMPNKGTIHLLKSAIPIFDELGSVIGVIDTFREIKTVRNLVTKMVGAKAYFTFDDIITKSHRVKNMIRLAKLVAENDSTVLIQGESGTGKELFAHAIHNWSPRRNAPFIVIDCSSIPRELVESEFFGYVEGAFTGARKGGHPGKFELANGGTVFLDEIGELPLEMQAKLLRVLQSRHVTRIGGHEPIPIDVRVIAATNRTLEEEVKNKNFRLDLFYRLNVVTFEIPPLRERPEDILPLANHFIRKFSDRHALDMPLTISTEAARALKSYTWPGNVRELENIIERACLYSKAVDLTPDLFPQKIFLSTTHPEQQSSQPANLNQSEKKTIEAALQQTNGNKSKAAKLLGIARSTLYEKLKKYKINV